MCRIMAKRSSSTAALLDILSSSETSDDQWGAIMTNEESESKADKDWWIGLCQLCSKICLLCFQEFPKNLSYYAQVLAHYA